MRALALAAVLALGGCVYTLPPGVEPVAVSNSQRSTPWRPAVAARAGDLAALQQLARDFPDSSSVHLRLLQAHFEENETAGTIREAVWLAERGYRFSDASRTELVKRAGETAIAAKLIKLLEGNARPTMASAAYTTIPADALLPEGLAFDPADGRMIVSTVISRKLFKQSSNGKWRQIDAGNSDSLSGIGFAPTDGRLWVSSANLGMTTKGEARFHGLLRFGSGLSGDSDRFSVPEGVNPSDMVIAGDGSVFVSDPTGGQIYRVDDETGAIMPLAAVGTFRSPQGLAISADGEKLYVSDYRYGIAVINLNSGSVHRLQAAAPMILDGIDGLWRVGNRLVGIQNGMKPMRIVEISLADDGMSAVGFQVLEQAHPQWTEPLGGAIYNGALYYIATGQWDRFGEGGIPKHDNPPGPTEVRRLPL